MQKIKRYIPILVTLLMLTAGFTACKKESYLHDGGLANAVTPLSTYDYLKGHTYHYFDTTILLIDHFNLKDSVNNSKTFFAFTDYAIVALMNAKGITSLDELYDSVSSKFLTQYMFGETITLDGAATVAVGYTDWAGASAPCAIKKTPATSYVSLPTTSLASTYYILDYVKVNGGIDGAAGTPAGDSVDVVLPCQTTGIQTSSGTTLHVLVNNANLQTL